MTDSPFATTRVLTPYGLGTVLGPQYDHWHSGSIVAWWVDLDGGGRKCFWTHELCPQAETPAHGDKLKGHPRPA